MWKGSQYDKKEGREAEGAATAKEDVRKEQARSCGIPLSSMAILEVRNVKKVYTTRFGGNQVQALSDVSFTVEKGEYVAIMGESGSGKTTLLNILAALDRPTAGEVLLNGADIVSIRERDISAFRRNNLGFVFQDARVMAGFWCWDSLAAG